MRAKSGTVARAKRKKVSAATKGMSHHRRRSYRLGKQAVVRSLQYAYRDRRNKKRDFRAVWIQRINAAARQEDMTYSKFISGLQKAGVTLDRKTLAYIAYHEPQAFKDLAKLAKK